MAQVALITGASSGIGLALTKHLLNKGWDVILADLNPPPAHEELPTDRTLYIKTDVSSWNQQAQLFEKAFYWHQRLDFAALNAGVADSDDIFNTINTTAPPSKPDMSVLDIDLYGIYYGIKLFAHYAAKNPTPGGKIVATASMAGLYSNPGVPQYCAAKHGVVGLVRGLALQAYPRHNITINAIAPGFVLTNIDPTIASTIPEEALTAMPTVMQAFDELMDPEKNHNGAVVECAKEGLFYRDPPEVKSQAMLNLLGTDALPKWFEGLIKRNVEVTLKRKAAEVGK